MLDALGGHCGIHIAPPGHVIRRPARCPGVDTPGYTTPPRRGGDRGSPIGGRWAVADHIHSKDGDGHMAGYSGTPLAKKLGLKAGQRVAFWNAPEPLPDGLDAPLEGVTRLDTPRSPLDLALLFADSRSELEAGFPRLAGMLTPAGMLWVAWPKRSSGVATDLDENVVRAVGLAAGLVDTKVCAIDEVWSGLKFVIRRKDRPGPGRP
jgi:hypothetical protein